METLLILLAVGALMFAFSRAAGNPLGHDGAYRRRRMRNWLPLGLIYALLYMGRYNLTVAKNALKQMSKHHFGVIFGAGTATYAVSFLLNGPTTDRIGGKRAILIAGYGSAVANGLLALLTYLLLTRPAGSLNLPLYFSLVYSLNMYFQSFGAVAVVKVNANWFHVRERGSFGGIFGVLISLGLYFAFDWGAAIVEALSIKPPLEPSLVQQGLRAAIIGSAVPGVDRVWWVFLLPGLALLAAATVGLIVLRDKPSQAGFADFDPGDASSGQQDNAPFHLGQVLKLVLTNKVIWIIGAIEMCSGVLRNGVMHWYPIYIKERGAAEGFLFRKHWGKLLCMAGIFGGMLAGFLSDKVFGSRRGPVAALLYFTMLVLAVIMIFSLQADHALGTLATLMSLSVIGVHGMLSGTATMDFGGRRAAGTAVGVIDGFVYLGTAIQSLALGLITTRDWSYWPVFLVPFALIGLLLALKIWAAFPGARKGGGH